MPQSLRFQRSLSGMHFVNDCDGLDTQFDAICSQSAGPFYEREHCHDIDYFSDVPRS